MSTMHVAPSFGTCVSGTMMSSHSQSSLSSGSGSGTDSYISDVKPVEWGGAKFLPSGDSLPATFNIALIKKLPMFPPPTGALEFYRQKLAQAPYENKTRLDFDLTDPYNRSINNEYNPLTDPHMILYLHKPRVHKRLLELGKITHDNKVRCSRKELNEYSKWLQHIGRQQFRKRAEEERKRTIMRQKRDNDVKVAVIHAEVAEVEQEEEQDEDEVEDETQSVPRSREDSGPVLEVKEADRNCSRSSNATSRMSDQSRRAEDVRKGTAKRQKLDDDVKVTVIHAEMAEDEEEEEEEGEETRVTSPSWSAARSGGDFSPGLTVSEADRNWSRSSNASSRTSEQTKTVGEVVPVGAGEVEKGEQGPGTDVESLKDSSRQGRAQSSSLEGESEEDKEETDLQVELVQQHKDKEQEEKERLKRAAQDIYTTATTEHHKRQKKELHKYKKDLEKYLDYIAEAECRRQENCAKQFEEGWTRPHVYARQYEDPPPHITEDSQARASRYQNQLQDEMNRRWQSQAGRLKELKDKGREKLRELEDTYTRSIVNAFTGMPLTDDLAAGLPAQDTCAVEITETGPLDTVCDQKSSSSKAPFSELSDVQPAMIETKGPASSTERSRGVTASRQNSKSLGSGSGVPRLSVKNMSSDGKQRHTSSRKVSKPPSDLTRVPSKGGVAGVNTYPTKTRLLGTEEPKPHPADEVTIFVAQEVLVQTGRGEGTSFVATDEAAEEIKSLVSETVPTILGTRASSCEMLTAEERGGMEELIKHLLEEMAAGKLDREDLIKLTTACAALTESNLADQATSTTSLGEERRMVKSGHPSDTSMASTADRKTPGSQWSDADQRSLTTLVEEVVKNAVRQIGEDHEDTPVRKSPPQEEYGQLVEDAVRNAVSQMSQELRDGTLSREDVREIGSAVASVIIGDIRSDSSLLGEEVVVPTLQRVLNEGENLDEDLLDQAMASLLSAYDQVSRRTDKSSYISVEDFVVEVLQRTRDAMEKGQQNVEQFLTSMEQCCQNNPLFADMELPCQHELIEVMSAAIVKLKAITDLCPVLCELVKVLLDQGQSTLMTRPEATTKSSLPKMDGATLEVMASTACGLEVALEVAGSVADDLYKEMLKDREFEHSLCLSLSPSFLLVLLTCWAEMTEAVPKETVALQTNFGELGYVPSLGEDVVLLALHRLWRDTVQNRLSSATLTLLSLHLAQVDVLAQPPCDMEYDEQGKLLIPTTVTSKITAMNQRMKEHEVDYTETKKLLAFVLQTYIQQRLQDGPEPAVPPEVLQDNRQCRCHMANLLAMITRHVLESVLLQAQDGLNDFGFMNIMLVTEILQLVSDCALADIRDSLQPSPGSATPCPADDPCLAHVVHATVQPEDQQRGTVQFLQSLVRVVENSAMEARHTIVFGAALKAEGQLIRMELGRLASEVCQLMSDMVAPPQQPLSSGTVVDKLTRFLTCLLQECQGALEKLILLPQVMYEFLCSMNPRLSYKEELKDSAEGQMEVLACLIQDLQTQKDKSPIFRKLVKKLSKMSIEHPNDKQVAEGMAAIAHVLSSVEPDVLKQFVQSTLYSLLAVIHGQEASTQQSESIELEHTSQSTTSTVMDMSTGNVLLVGPEDMEESTVATVSSVVLFTEPNAHMSASNLRVAKSSSAESVSLEAEVDVHSKKEISHEADIIVHMALHTTMDQLGVLSSHTEIQTRGQVSLSEVKDLGTGKNAKDVISNLQDLATHAKAPPSKNFTDLDPSIAAYAQGLLIQVIQHMEEFQEAVSEEDVEPIGTETIASTILSKTFRSIERELSSGRLPVTQSLECASCDSISGRLTDKASISLCVTHTLCAVRSELDLLEMTTGISERQAMTKATSRPDTLTTLKKARQIVDFLIKRLQNDTDSAKVEFRWTPYQKLSVVNSVGREKSFTVENVDWSAPHDVLAETILQVFRRVLKDMQTQNQFFNPDSQEAVALDTSDVFTLPSLPFLLDEFILSHLQNINNQLFRYVLGQSIDLDTMTKEAVLVACTFNDNLREMMELESSTTTDENTESKKRTVLKILDEYVTRLLCDLCNTCSDHIQSIVDTYQKSRTLKQKKKRGKTLQMKRRGPSSPTLVVYRPLNQVKSELANLLSSIKNLKNAVRPEKATDEEMSEDLQEKDLVLHAISQVVLCVKKGHVADYVLKDLFHIFFKDACDTESKDCVNVRLMYELESLATAVMEGNVPGDELATIAAEISSLEKRHVEDPRRFAQQMRRVSLSCTAFSPEYLKMAVSDLLAGYRRCSDPTSDASSFRQPNLYLEKDQEPNLSDQYGYSCTNSLSDHEPSSVPHARSSIDARTISKICLSDDSENRETSLRSVYSTQVSLKTSPLSTAFTEQNTIAEQSETFTTSCLGSYEKIAEADRHSETPQDESYIMTEMVSSGTLRDKLSWAQKEEEGAQEVQRDKDSEEETSDRASEVGQDEEPKSKPDGASGPQSEASSVHGDDITTSRDPTGEGSKSFSFQGDDIMSPAVQTENTSKASSVQSIDTTTSNDHSGGGCKVSLVQGDGIVVSGEQSGTGPKASSVHSDDNVISHGNTTEEEESDRKANDECADDGTSPVTPGDSREPGTASEGQETAADGGRESESGQEGKERGGAVSDSSRANKSEESLDSAEGDWNRSAIRTIKSLVCRMDEVKGPETLPTDSSQLFSKFLHQLSKLQNKHQVSSRQSNRNRDIPVQQHETHHSNARQTENQLLPKQQKTNTQNTCDLFVGHQNAGEHFVAQQNHHQQSAMPHNADRPVPMKQARSRDVSSQQENRAVKLKDRQNKHTNLSATCPQSFESRSTPIRNTSEGRSAACVEGFGREPQHQVKVVTTRSPSCQRQKASVDDVNQHAKFASSEPHHGHARDGTFNMSLTLSKLSSRTTLKGASLEQVSTPCSVSQAVQMAPVDSGITSPVKKHTRRGCTLHPYLEKQAIAKQYNSRPLTSPETRAQQKAFAAGFSIYNNKKEKLVQAQKQKHNQNVNRQESECLKNNQVGGTQSSAEGTHPVSSSAEAYVQSKIPVSPCNKDQSSSQDSWGSKKSLSTQRSSAAADDQAKAVCSHRDADLYRNALAVPHPPSTSWHRSLRGCTETPLARDCSVQPCAESPTASGRSPLTKKNKATERTTIVQMLPLNIQPHPPEARNRQGKHTGVSDGGSVTFPLLPASSYRKDARTDGGKQSKCPAAAGGVKAASHHAERASPQRQTTGMPGADSNTQSVPVLPHPPKGAPRIAMDDLKAKLHYVIKGLKTSRRSMTEEQKQRQRSMTEEHKAKYNRKTELKTDSETADVQPKDCNMLKVKKHKHGIMAESPQTEKGRTEDGFNPQRGHTSGVPSLPQTASPPKVPYPPQQPLPDHMLLLKEDEGAAGRHRTRPKPVEVSLSPLGDGAVTVVHSPHSPGCSRPRLPAVAQTSVHRNAQGDAQLVPQCPIGDRSVQRHSRRVMRSMKALLTG